MYSVDENVSIKVFVVVGEACELVTVDVYVSGVGVIFAVLVFLGTLAVIVIVKLPLVAVAALGDRVACNVRVFVCSGEKDRDGRERVIVTVFVMVSESILGDS